MHALYRFWLLPLWACTVSFSTCANPEKVLEAYGYTSLKPPSRLLAPGTLLLIEQESPLVASIICTAEASLGHDIKLVESPTAAGTLHYLQGYKTAMDVHAMSVLKQSGKYEALDDVTFTLQNPVILELTDAMVLEGMLYRTDSCRRAVKNRVKAGYTITMVSSVLQADGNVSAKWSRAYEESMSEQQKINILQDLSVNLGTSSHQTGEATVSANGLYWGLRDSEFLAALSQEDIDEQVFDRDATKLPAKINLAVEGHR